jgi:hypothetical protein
MSKRTAVDVYQEHIRYLIAMGLKLSEPDRTFLNSAYRDCKAMEREQIEHAFDVGYGSGSDAPPRKYPFLEYHEAFEYYNETYKGGEQ